MNEEVQAVFRTRDEAVRKQDARSFRSTQLSEIDSAASESYLSVNDMTTEILHTHEESEDVLVAFVKETYTLEGKQPRSGFLIYYLTHTTKGWKIYKLR